MPWYVYAGAAAVTLLISSKARASSRESSARDFASRIPAGAQPYAADILYAAERYNVEPLLLVAIMERESRFGLALTPRGPGGTGDYGHGRGLMQIDDRVWTEWLAANDWKDARVNITKGAEILADNARYFVKKGLAGNEVWLAALAAYNAGPGTVWRAIEAGRPVDSVTTGGNYASAVFARADALGAAETGLV